MKDILRDDLKYKEILSNPQEKDPCHQHVWDFAYSYKYRVTQNKVHHLLAILYLIFEVNFTQVSYVFQCIIVNEVQFNEV